MPRPVLTAVLLAIGLQGRVVGQSATYYSVPTWSPDGRTIVFESDRDGEAAIYRIAADGTGLRRLTPPGVPGEQPNWSHDGDRIVFSSHAGDTRQLSTMRPDGTEVVPIPNSAGGFLSAYSADGAWLLFASQDTPPTYHYRVFVMRPDGTARREIGDPTSSNEDPRWTRDGTGILYIEVPLLERGADEAPRDWLRRLRAGARSIRIDLDGSSAATIGSAEFERLSRDRALSPDGRFRVVSTTIDGVAGLYVEEEATGSRRLLDRAGG